MGTENTGGTCECYDWQQQREGAAFCLNCNKPTERAEKLYAEYLKLCDIYCPLVAIRLVYG